MQRKRETEGHECMRANREGGAGVEELIRRNISVKADQQRGRHECKRAEKSSISVQEVKEVKERNRGRKECM
jgi:hypothetical protein